MAKLQVFLISALLLFQSGRAAECKDCAQERDEIALVQVGHSVKYGSKPDLEKLGGLAEKVIAEDLDAASITSEDEDLEAASDTEDSGPSRWEIGGRGGAFIKGDLHVHVPAVGFHVGLQEFNEHYAHVYTIPDPTHTYTKSKAETQKSGGGQWPAPIIPFVGGGGDDTHGSQKIFGLDGTVTTWDLIYDQSTTRLPGVFKQLKDAGFGFVVLAAHDVAAGPRAEENMQTEARKVDPNLVLYFATEYRRERDLKIGSRTKYALRDDAGGAHVGLDVLDVANDMAPINGSASRALLKTAQHPNVSPSDRMDIAYYAHRKAGRVTGTEAGTPSQKDDRTTIEVYNDWMGESQDQGKNLNFDANDGQDAGEIEATASFEGHTPMDSAGFAVNKWDAALSRGTKLYATCSADSFAKSHQYCQMNRLASVKREWDTAMQNRDNAKLEQLAEFIRSKQTGSGYIMVWLPRGAKRTSASIMAAINAGDFYAVANHHLGTPVPEVVSAKVAKDSTNKLAYMVELGGDFSDVTCDAVTNHGRLFRLRATRGTFTAKVKDVCGSDDPDKFQCAYIRIQCKRPAVSRPRADWDYNYVFTQPWYLPNFDSLTTHFEDPGLAVEDFKEEVRNSKKLMNLVKKAYSKSDLEAKDAQAMAEAAKFCRENECSAEQKQAIVDWEHTPVWEDIDLGDDINAVFP